jgi:hypothetical protein
MVVLVTLFRPARKTIMRARASDKCLAFRSASRTSPLRYGA